MKLTYTFFIILSLITSSYSQVPQGIPYQSALRNSSGGILANQNVSIRFSIHDSSITGNIVYQESHSATTSSQGIVTLTIGQGTPTTGTFANINWGQHSKFLQVEMDATGGITYVDLGTQQMMSVPYALYAGTSGAIITAPYSIGLNLDLGGYVFWVSPDGKHGLVCETQDQGYTDWYSAENLVSNPIYHTPSGQTYRDWRLPTQFELNEILIQRTAIGGFLNFNYWSYTGLAYHSAACIDFLSGLNSEINKNQPGKIRTVRSF